jgi:hypothetical protein
MGKKIYTVDMNVDTSEVAFQLLQRQPNAKQQEEFTGKLQAWAKADPKTRGDQPKLNLGEMTAPEYFKSIIMNAISQAHRSGNTAVLRRTKSIAEKLDVAIKKEGKLMISENDYNFMKSSVSKADQWNNREEVANSVLIVEDQLLNSEYIEE